MSLLAAWLAPGAAIADPPAPASRGPSVSVKPTGYVEAYYAFNANRPSNGVTNFRAFDNRHNALTLLNAALGVDAAIDSAYARVVFQVGGAPDSYVGLSEPRVPATGGAGASSGETWRHVQEAYLGWAGPVRAEAGIFLTPIGPESMALKDQWSWSRSNLFYGLPFYHTGARVSRDLGDRTSLRAGVFNGWNSVVDNNDEKTVSLELTHRVGERVTFHAQYFGGVERAQGAVEGRAWRHLFDSFVKARVHERVELSLQSDVGFEPNRVGVSGWASAAAFGRVKLHERLFFVVAGDLFHERRAAADGREAAAIFWPARWVSSQWVTLDVRPASQLSVRLELRHDEAASRMFFRGNVFLDPTTGEALPNARAQDTATLGAVVWF